MRCFVCYYGLAKPEPRTKSKTVVSKDKCGTVFVDGRNVMADIIARSQSLHFVYLSVHLLDPQSLLGLTTFLTVVSVHGTVASLQ